MKSSQYSLSDALFPKVRQLVLGLLFSHPDKHFHTNEIIRETGSGTGSVQRELERLTSANLITQETVGKQKQYQANPHSPLFTEIRSIVLKTFGLTELLQDTLAPLSQKIKIAFVYGSIAKQKENSKSDIDLMIISDTLSYSELFPLLEAPQNQLGREINPTFYTKEEWENKKKRKNNFILKIIEQPKLFIIGTEHELEQLGKSC